MVTLGQKDSLTLTYIHCEMKTHKEVKIQWFNRTLKMHTNDKNSTSP